MRVGFIGGAPFGYLPWISRPGGAGGPTCISSYFVNQPAAR